MRRPIRLLIAEDHKMIREGLQIAFQDTEIEVVGEATSGDEAIQMALAHVFDLILVDINLPGCNGFEVLEQVKADQPDVAIVVYSHSDRPDFRARAQRLNASGYILKTAERKELIDAIRRAGRGEDLWDRSNQRDPSGLPITRRE